jgi:hypothetical protein
MMDTQNELSELNALLAKSKGDIAKLLPDEVIELQRLGIDGNYIMDIVWQRSCVPCGISRFRVELDIIFLRGWR